MNKKIICIIFCTALLATALPMTSARIIGNDSGIESTNILDGYIVDQSQTLGSGSSRMVIETRQCAQSFKPTVTPLVKVDIKCFKIDVSDPLVISIRDDLNGEDLTYVSISSGNVGSYPPSWVEIDFPDIEVVPEQTYYIVAHCEGEYIHMNGYFWTKVKGSNDKYERGHMFHSPDNGVTWIDPDGDNYHDFAFKTFTYGQNQPPNTPSIDGPTSGKPEVYYDYEFSTTDPEGDDVFYIVDWGHGSTSTYGPYPSGDTIIRDHKWYSEGTYEIKVKAQDVNSAESDWATLEVTMPKNKTMDTPFLNFLEQHPHMFPLLRQLLGLL